MTRPRPGDLLAEHGITYAHRRSLGTPPDLRLLYKNGRVAEGATCHRRVLTDAPQRRPPGLRVVDL